MGANQDGYDSVSVVAAQNPNVQTYGRQEEFKDNESVYSHATNASAVTYATEMLGITANTSFLLIDLREPDEYNLWRIKEAINFPAPNIARDKTIPELYRFKN